MEPLEFLLRHGYVVLFVVVLGEQLGLPLLGAPLLLAAGALAAAGRLQPLAVLALPVLACLVGDSVWYWLGRRRGASVLSFLCRISLEPDSCVRRTEEVFLRHGARVLLVAKFLPGLNTVAPPLSGVAGIPLGRFLRCDALGATLWTVTYAGLGYLFSHQLGMVAEGLARLGTGAAVLLGGGLGAYVAGKFVQRRLFIRRLRTARIAPEELMVRLAGGEDVLILDLRTAVQADGARIRGAILVAPEELERRHAEIPRDREIVVYCS